VIHAHGVKAALLTLLQPLTGENSPVVVTFHNLWQGGALTLPLRLLMRRAAAGVAVSEAVRLRLEHSGIRPSMLTVIPNGVDLEAFSPSPVPPQSRPFTISFLGRLTEEKGVPELLSLVDRWPASVPARFLIAGDGPLRRAVSEAARAGSPICFLGHQQDPRVVYRQTDVVVMPSHSEGHPITALETMASGLPLVATQVGGLAEIIVAGETGLLVPPGNPAALLEALLGLASNRQRREAMGAAGRCRAEVEFGLTRMLDRLEALYRRVLPPSRAPRPES
jgi:glycosyltransferase involved in cell wall biosynthesis